MTKLRYFPVVWVHLMLAFPRLFAAENAVIADCTGPASSLSMEVASQLSRLVPQPASTPVRALLAPDGELRESWLYLSAIDVSDSARHRLLAVDVQGSEVLWSSSPVEGPHYSSAADDSAIAHARGPIASLTDASGRTYRAYFGDDRGDVWRLDLPPGPVSAWRLRRFARLSALAPADGSLRFPVAPDLYRGRDTLGRAYDGLVLPAVVTWSGGRRIDLLRLRDYALSEDADLQPLSARSLVPARECSSDADCTSGAAPGWILRGAITGDRLVSSPLVDGGRVLLVAHSAASWQCDEGTALRYASFIDLPTGLPSVLPAMADDESLALGRQSLVDPEVADGQLRLPGLRNAVEQRGLPPALLDAAGLRAALVYWRDLLLDAD